MAVRSWPPSRASTTRPPARPISCFVRYPKPATREQRKCRRRAKVAAGIGLLAEDQRIRERNYIILKTQRGFEKARRITQARLGFNALATRFQLRRPWDGSVCPPPAPPQLGASPSSPCRHSAPQIKASSQHSLWKQGKGRICAGCCFGRGRRKGNRPSLGRDSSSAVPQRDLGLTSRSQQTALPVHNML